MSILICKQYPYQTQHSININNHFNITNSSTTIHILTYCESSLINETFNQKRNS